MKEATEGVGFMVWEGKRACEPVKLPVLMNWVEAQRVKADTWVYAEGDAAWRRACQMPELRMFFPRHEMAPAMAKAGAGVSEQTALIAVQPNSLRRVKVLSEFRDDQLLRFANFMEVVRVRQEDAVVRQGEMGDAMFMVLEGELRVRMLINNKETTLVTLTPGDFFGEISLFDHGPRSAEVVANKVSKLLKITALAFQNMLRDAPDLAAPFLFAMAKTLTARIRADNKRYRDAINFARTSGK
ncbi:MAG: cyclic nucleotide-binding domain-containing protein [Verrucomicrobia bacterium]|nr:cyclic nucleotide-binding domain-containing protein [Verrucomicrobiota bacterium]